MIQTFAVICWNKLQTRSFLGAQFLGVYYYLLSQNEIRGIVFELPFPPIAQLVERRAYTSVVLGSSPSRRTKSTNNNQIGYTIANANTSY